jgi:transcription elongation factor Elf1
MISMRITLHQDETSQDYIMVVACGNCKDPPTRHEYRFPVAKAEIDVYNLFVDEFVKSGG